MVDVTLVLGAVLLLVVLYCLYWYLWPRIRNYPPEPVPSLPLIGHLFAVNFDESQTQILKWYREKKMPIMYVRFLLDPIIFVNRLDLIKEVLVKRGEEFAARPDMWTQDYFGDTAGTGLFSTSGPLWEEQRRFATKVLRHFGVGKSLIEEKIHTELGKTCRWFDETIRKSSGKAVLDPSDALEYALGNIISSVVTGHTYEHGDPELKLNFKTFHDLLLLLGLGGDFKVAVLTCFPWARFLPIMDGFGYKPLAACRKVVHDFTTREIERHQKTLGDGHEPTDFTDAFLHEMERRKKEGIDMGFFSIKQLHGCIGDLWTAGSETTMSSLRWCIVYMIHYPEIQQKIREEIYSVVGPDRQISLTDKPQLPYASACLMEMLRIGNVADTTNFHCVQEDTTVGGYRIPKGVRVAMNLYTVHMDPDVFPEPEVFKPERFYDAATNTVRKVDNWIPFGCGYRMCLGEQLGKTELFIVVFTLLQRYKFEMVRNEPPPSLKAVRSMTLQPPDYRCEISFAQPEKHNARAF